MDAGGTQDMKQLEPATEEVFSCRRCRSVLFTDADLERHTAGQQMLPNRASSQPCSSYFLQEAPSWISPEALSENRILCPNPKCAARLGSLSWSGAQCSCGTWVTPAVQVPRSKVDSKVRRARVRPQSEMELAEEGVESAKEKHCEQGETGPSTEGFGSQEAVGARTEPSPGTPESDSALKVADAAPADAAVEEEKEVSYLLRSALALVHSDRIADRFEEALREAGICETVQAVQSTKQLRRYLLERGYNPFSLVIVAKAAGDKAFEIAESYADKASVYCIMSTPPTVVQDCCEIVSALTR